MTATVLAGDIGGTHARFARVHSGPGRVVLGEAQTYDVAGSPSLEALVVRYLADHPGVVAAAAIGIAAPIVGGRANPINLPWAVDESELRSAIGSEHGHLINDLLANAWGIAELDPAHVEELQSDRIGLGGNRAVCSAGTGLGIAGLVPGQEVAAATCWWLAKVAEVMPNSWVAQAKASAAPLSCASLIGSTLKSPSQTTRKWPVVS